MLKIYRLHTRINIIYINLFKLLQGMLQLGIMYSITIYIRSCLCHIVSIEIQLAQSNEDKINGTNRNNHNYPNIYEVGSQ